MAVITRKSLDSWWYLLSRNSCILLKIKGNTLIYARSLKVHAREAYHPRT